MALPRPALCLGAGALYLLISLVCFSSAAFAAEYEVLADPAEPALGEVAACPSAVEPYEGEDAVAGELRRLRIEQREVCLALADRLGLIRQRAFWAVQEAVQAAGQRASANATLTTANERLAPPLTVTDAGAGESTSALVEAVDASGNATKESLWFLAGLAVALLAAYALLRQVMPRG